MPSSQDQKMDTVTMMSINLIPLSDGRHFKLKVVVDKSNHINSLWNSHSIKLDTTYYPQHNLGLVLASTTHYTTNRITG
jgi:hypothetical protein